MRISEKKSVRIMIFLLAGILFMGVSAYAEEMTIHEEFKSGFGTRVGKMVLVQGEVLILHEKMPGAYRAGNDLPLFEGDTIITRERGRIRFELNDGSVMTLASETKLVINRSIYNPEKKTRSSFLGMTLGKARFWVKKLMGFKTSEFKVKTKTAVVGVRGSDFIIVANAERTEVIALEKTDLEVVSLIGPEEEPTTLADFEHTVIEEGYLPSGVEELPSQEIELMMRDFTIDNDSFEPGSHEGGPEFRKKRPEFREPQGDRILVPPDYLVPPERLGEFDHTGQEEPDKPKVAKRPPHDIAHKEELIDRMNDIMEKNDEIAREHQEWAGMEHIKPPPCPQVEPGGELPPGCDPIEVPDDNPLPPFPGSPE